MTDIPYGLELAQYKLQRAKEEYDKETAQAGI